MQTVAKKCILTPAIFFLSCLSFVRAQTVTIPDPNFATALSMSAFSSCISGNQLDVGCVQAHTAAGDTVLNFSYMYNINDLSGIEYFLGLKILMIEQTVSTVNAFPPDLRIIEFSGGQLTSVPALPPNLMHLKIINNQISTLPLLPSSLISLDVSSNSISSLPAIPMNLLYLSCENNQLTALPSLPASLLQLNCSGNQITTLPTLPNGITYLFCSFNQLANIPTIPSSLTSLQCSNNQISTLPVIPSSLSILNCSHNNFSTLPNFTGTTMQECDFSYNQLTSITNQPGAGSSFNVSNNLITSIPTLAHDYSMFNCSHNSISTIPAFNHEVQYFDCSYNLITSLVNYPTSCSYFHAEHNQLTSIPVFGSVSYYVFHHNQITSLPPFISAGMGGMDFRNNLLTYVDTLPQYVQHFKADSNNISCLPIVYGVNEAVSFAGNPFSCIPSLSYPMYGPAFAGYPICNASNSNGCPFEYSISGNLYFDNNSSCSFNLGDSTITNVGVKLYQGATLLQTAYTSNGIYSFEIAPGNYTVVVDTSNFQYSLPCQTSSTNVVVLTNSISQVNFGFLCSPQVDLECYATSIGGMTFPGQTFRITPIISENYTHCDSVIPATVTVQYSGSASYSNPHAGALTPTSISGNTLTYSISDFSTINQGSFAFNMLTDTTAQIGDSVCFDVTVSTPLTENSTSNNTNYSCFAVINSYDPNMKTVNQPTEILYPFNDELVYTVYFQNTGNAPAINIKIVDTISYNLDLSTLRIISSSHLMNTSTIGNRVFFQFPNIMLQDSTTNEPASHGYVQYSIRPSYAEPGTVYENRANIYFDYNDPILTNTTHNMIVLPANFGMEEILEVNVNAYPNPATGSITLQSEFLMKEIYITDIRGNVCKTISADNHQLNIDLTELSSGLYFVSIQTNNGNTVKKIIVQK